MRRVFAVLSLNSIRKTEILSCPVYYWIIIDFWHFPDLFNSICPCFLSFKTRNCSVFYNVTVVFPIFLFSWCKKRPHALLADGADEAGWVVSLAQSSDHFPLHKVPTAIAAGAVHALVVQRAQILSILHEEAPLGEVTAANCMGHTHTHWHSESQVI